MRRSLLPLLLLTACGYALVGTGNILDPSLKTLYVPAFVNRTTRVELEQRVTQSVADEFVSRGQIEVPNPPVEAAVMAAAKSHEKIQSWVAVPGKLVNVEVR